MSCVIAVEEEKGNGNFVPVKRCWWRTLKRWHKRTSRSLCVSENERPMFLHLCHWSISWVHLSSNATGLFFTFAVSCFLSSLLTCIFTFNSSKASRRRSSSSEFFQLFQSTKAFIVVGRGNLLPFLFFYLGHFFYSVVSVCVCLLGPMRSSSSIHLLRIHLRVEERIVSTWGWVSTPSSRVADGWTISPLVWLWSVSFELLLLR